MIDSSHLAFEHLNESLVIKMHYVLHPPCSKRETGTWGHHEATNLTGQTHTHKDWQMDCATDCRGKIYHLERANKPKQKHICSPALLSHLSVMSSSSRNCGKNLGQNQSEKPREMRGTASLVPHRSVQPLPALQMRSRSRIQIQFQVLLSSSSHQEGCCGFLQLRTFYTKD